MINDTVLFSVEGPIATMTLNRPDKLNALNNEMILGMVAVCDELDKRDDVKILICKGAGRAFSAGVDLKATTADDFASDTTDPSDDFMSNGMILDERIQNLKQVTIAQIHGYCFTGALELALFFDMIYCTRDTQFGDTHAKWSVIPRWGMTQRLSRTVGFRKAKELTFRALSIDGVEAEKNGLVNEAFSKKEIDEQVSKICNQILGNSFEAISAIKKLYNEGYNTTLSEGIQIEKKAKLEMKNTGSLLAQFDKKKGV